MPNAYFRRYRPYYLHSSTGSLLAAQSASDVAANNHVIHFTPMNCISLRRCLREKKESRSMKSQARIKKLKGSPANEQALQKVKAKINSIVDRKIQFAIIENVPLQLAFEAATRHCQILMLNAKGDSTPMFPTYSEFVVRAIKIAELYQAAGHTESHPSLRFALGSPRKHQKTTISVSRMGMPGLITDGKNRVGRIYVTVAVQCYTREVLVYDIATNPSAATWASAFEKIPADRWQAAVCNFSSTEEKRVRPPLIEDGKELVPAPFTQGHADMVLHALALIIMAATNPAGPAKDENSSEKRPTLESIKEMVAKWVEIHNRLQRAVTSFAHGMPKQLLLDNAANPHGRKATDLIH